MVGMDVMMNERGKAQSQGWAVQIRVSSFKFRVPSSLNQDFTKQYWHTQKVWDATFASRWFLCHETRNLKLGTGF
jgi:hypothetical protein